MAVQLKVCKNPMEKTCPHMAVMKSTVINGYNWFYCMCWRVDAKGKIQFGCDPEYNEIIVLEPADPKEMK